MRAFFLAVILWMGLAQVALAEEAIRRFVSDMTVNMDGSLDVVETITVRGEQNQIKRGIIRDFPTEYKDKDGNEVSVDFELKSVLRDGQPDAYQKSFSGNGVSIRIGKEDVFLAPGNSTYQISYRTTRQLGFFADYDELYWNVTGNGWTFPIEKAEAVVRLPSGAVIKSSSLYTGFFGATGNDATVLEQRGNNFTAATTRRLAAGEGFTIALSWQKGIVTAPTASDLKSRWIMDHLGIFTGAATLLASFLYYLFAWRKVGRDPPKQTIVPLFKPPEGLGPAGVRHVWKNGFDDQAFAAAIVGLAVKKRLKITDVDGEYSVTRTGQDGPPLTQSEQELLSRLPQGTLEFKQSNHSAISSARSVLSRALDEQFSTVMVVRNFKWFFLGALLSLIGIFISSLLMRGSDGVFLSIGTMFTTIWWGVVLAVGTAMMKGLIKARGFLGKAKNLFGMFFLIPFVFGGIIVPVSIASVIDLKTATLIFVAIAVLLAISNIVFYRLLKAPTVQGQKLMSEIEGFRMYLTTAEEERLKVLHLPEKTPELFERYMPYAMALDCESEWNEKFTAVLAAAAAAGVATTPYWYTGSSWNSGRFSNDLSSGLTSSISSSSSPPGSSSGSYGGGSSGGGGGGGGGSGW